MIVPLDIRLLERPRHGVAVVTLARAGTELRRATGDIDAVEGRRLLAAELVADHDGLDVDAVEEKLAELVRRSGPPLRVLTISELLARPPAKWLVQGILPEVGLAVVFGQPGAGKSFIVLDLMLCVAAGKAWCGRRAQLGRTLELVGEGQSGFPDRLRAWRLGNAFPELGSLPALFVESVPALVDAAGQRSLVETVESCNSDGDLKLVVIETLSQGLAGEEESDAKTMSNAVRFLTGLATKHRLCVLVVHHQRKGEGDGLMTMRGSSALAAGADAVWHVQGDVESGARMRASKMKDGSDDITLHLLLRKAVGRDETGIVDSLYVTQETDAEREDVEAVAVREFVAAIAKQIASEEFTAGEIASAARRAGYAEKRAVRLRDLAITQGPIVLIRRVGPKKLYRFAPGSDTDESARVPESAVPGKGSVAVEPACQSEQEGILAAPGSLLAASGTLLSPSGDSNANVPAQPSRILAHPKGVPEGKKACVGLVEEHANSDLSVAPAGAEEECS